MNNRPVIFISAVSKELKTARQAVANCLTSLGYTPDWQDIFGTEAGDLLEILRRKVDAASAVIQLVGNCYGSGPPAPVPGFGLVSFTQYEALYALRRRKKVFHLFLGQDFPPETDAPAEPDELRALQTAYRDTIKATGHLHHHAADSAELENKVLRLRDDLATLRRRTRQWAALVSLAVLLIAGGVAWIIFRPAPMDPELAGIKQVLADVVVNQTVLLEIFREYPAAATRRATVDNTRGTGSGNPAVFASLDEKHKLPPGTVEKQLPRFAAELLQRSGTDALDRARALLIQREYAEAEREAATTFIPIIQHSPSDVVRNLAAREIAGYAAASQFHYQDALDHFRTAALLTNKDRDAAEWARIHYWVAFVLVEMGEYAEAEGILGTIIPVSAAVLGAEHIDTLARRINRAVALGKQEKHTEAEAEYREVLEILRRVSDPEHAETLLCRTNRAIALQALDKLTEAETEHRDILAIRLRLLGPEHFDTLVSRQNLAAVLTARRQYVEAMEIKKDVLAIRVRILGEDNPATLVSHYNMAAALAQSNDFRAALSEAETSYWGLKRVLGPEHPTTIQALGLTIYLDDKVNRLPP